MSADSLRLRTWSRKYLAWCTGTSLLAFLVPESKEFANSIANVLTLVPMLYLLRKLPYQGLELEGPLADASKKAVTWFLVGGSLVFAAGFLTATGLDLLKLPIVLAAMAAIAKSFVHMCRIGLVVGIAGRGAAEADATCTGRTDTLLSLGYYASVFVAAIAIQALGTTLFR